MQRVLDELAINNVRHELRTTENYADLSDIGDGTLDFALVDGTDREGSILSVVPKLKRGVGFYLDNSDKDMTRLDGDLRRAETRVARRGGGTRRLVPLFLGLLADKLLRRTRYNGPFVKMDF